MDGITLSRISLLHPQLRDEALEIYKEICSRLTKNVICRFAWTLRTNIEQDELYTLGRTKVNPAGKSATRPMGNIVTFARGGQSNHNYGLAIDVVFLVDKDGNGSYETASWDIDKDFDGDGIADWKEVDFVFNMHGWKGLYHANGVRWDFPHFEKTFGLSISQLQKLPVLNGYVVLKSL